LKQFSKNLSIVNLSRMFRHRDGRPTMHSLELFSQDIILNYLIKQKVPSTEELKRLYEEDTTIKQD